MELSESLEDYLETILALEKKNKVARVKDIAQKMNILRGSVTGALKKMAEKDLINYEPYGFITLTARGLKIAREVTWRHEVIKDFLERVLQMEPVNAEANACRMEHAMDKDAFDRLVSFIEYLKENPETSSKWTGSFAKYYRQKTAKQKK